MSDKDTCPVNGCNLQGKPIPIPARDLYEEGVTHYSRMIGVEVPGVYDGVLYWACPDCGARWHRFGGDGWGADLHKAAQPYVAASVAGVASA